LRHIRNKKCTCRTILNTKTARVDDIRFIFPAPLFNPTSLNLPEWPTFGPLWKIQAYSPYFRTRIGAAFILRFDGAFNRRRINEDRIP